ncbi:MAG TPA: hypothetical protein PKD49_00555 [Hyphomicrobium sp.]|nr:hypothetical protein [Hyphomicrobium sp.]
MQRFLTIVLVLVFMARSIVPAGFMLQSTDTAGHVQVVVCTGSGFETITVDRDGLPVPSQHGEVAGAQCPYSAATAAVTEPDAVPSLAVAVRYSAVAYKVERDLHAADPKPHELSARGPPVIRA